MTQRSGFRFTILSATALGLALAGSASGQSSDPIDDILVCQQIADEAARLACFDAAASQLSSERENGLVAIYRQDVEAVERDSFGFDLPSMPRLSLSMFSRGSGNSPDPLDPSSTPERLAAAEAGVAAPPTLQPAPERQPAAPPSNAQSTDEAPSRGLFARLTGRDNAQPETPAEATDDRTPINGVEVVQRNDEGSVERVVMEIERIRPMGYERHRFYMSNGQVWDQSGAGRINYDDDGPNFAEIRRASLDSYLMQINGRGRAIRVHRER
ncbi:MAG: hypothetical protein DHS20C06_06770 [Hyphobacterium sp.]|nr:MAG: hypothetical protein DHS20C06_06770 [Hyphobacterium sp.]